MSQWNNSYAYSNQYQDTAAWHGEASPQYGSQPPAYLPAQQYDPNHQYVSFDQFLSQMQTNRAAPPAANPANSNTPAADYDNAQYQSYTGNQYNYQNVPSSSQNAHDTYNYESNASSSNNYETYQAQPSYNTSVPDSSAINEVASKSNLTATATEFVPKNTSMKPSYSTQHIKPESTRHRNGVKESKSSHGSSSDTNWRERPSTSNQNSNHRQDYKHNEGRYEYNSKQDSNNSRDTNSKDNTYRDSNSRNYDNRNHESRNYESRNDSRYDHRNNESSSRNYDSRYNDRGQKSSSKFKNKDSERTFYNSTINKNGQEQRNGRESSGRGRNYQGSSRLRAVERNITEDEQFASNYLQFKDERVERIHKENVPSPKHKKKQGGESEDNINVTQRERLSEQLDKGTLECLVCCDRVKQVDPIWSCPTCYHVLHLRCIRKWANSSMVEGKWRCPACQTTSAVVPSEYRCLCGGARAQDWARGGAAHSCGAGCRRPRACEHICPLVCHPGPCPSCTATVLKLCGCGAESKSVMCGDKTPVLCGRECGRGLPCGAHACRQQCHEGACGDCTHTIQQVCYCEAAAVRVVACTRESAGETRWECGAVCTWVRGCGVHACRRACHAPPCPPCALSPENVLTCPCGHTRIEKGARQLCTDPVPLCDNICAKPLACGPQGDKHFCKLKCHAGECPPCLDKTLVQCRCGHSSRDVDCAELAGRDTVTCQKKCNKKLSCGRHRCREVCCADAGHRCRALCGRNLPCQLHRCEETCHTGHCPPCPIVSFEELTCSCGAEAVLPPVRCGTRPPACARACVLPRRCRHPPHHSCHLGPCPPCVVLTTLMCYGQHEERKTIPCSQGEFSCGMPCGKPLPCGKHTCIKTCHQGPCDAGKCVQPCLEKRPMCGHPCAAPCHAAAGGPCPGAAPCRRAVRATCQCGRRSAERGCADNARDLAKIMSALAATKMQEGGSVDISEMRPGAMLKTLECDDECRVEARTRQLALALQIRNPDVSAKLAPRYSDTLRATAAREPAFAAAVHDRLTELVQLAKKSKQKTRSHSFPSMNWQKRQFIHELCEHFGCESVAYDAEPNRNVVATADKEKSWLPAMSVLEVLSREAGKRRVPGPVLRNALPAGAAGAPGPRSGSGWATLTSSNAWAARSHAAGTGAATAAPAAPAAPAKIDYFDNPPDN